MDRLMSATLPLSGTLAREIIKKLDTGTVPENGFQRFSAGRERWMRSIQIDLEDCASDETISGRVRLVNGRNGDGKTHLLHMIRDAALSEGYPVAYTIVSSTMPLHRWDHFYAGIAQSIRTPSGRVGVRDIFASENPAPEIQAEFSNRAASIRSIPRIQPDFANALYRYATAETPGIDRQQELFALVAWLEGHPTGNLRSLGINSKIDRTNGASIMNSLVGALKHFGFPGLLVIVDEMESIMALGQIQRDESYQTLRLLLDGSNVPRHGIVIASTTPSMYVDPLKGLPSYPALWSRLHVDGASPSIDYDSTVIDLTRTPLTQSDYLQIGEAVSGIFAVAKGITDPWPNVRENVQDLAHMAATGNLALTFSATRVFVKVVTDLLNAFNETGSIPHEFFDVRRAFRSADNRLAH